MNFSGTKTKQFVFLSLKYGFFESTTLHNLGLKCRPNISLFSTTAWYAQGDDKKPGVLVKTYKKYEKKYLDYIEKRFPRYYKVNMQVITGAKTTWTDTKYRLHLRRNIKESGISYLDLPWKDIMFIRQYRRDLFKVMPTLILCCLPVVFYAVLVVVALKPRLLLSQQFFSAKQQNDYRWKDHQKRIKSYTKVLKHMKETKCKTTADQEALNAVVKSVDTGVAMSSQDLLQSKQLFAGSLNIFNLQRNQLVDICKLLVLNPFLQPSFLLRRRLVSNLAELIAIDKGIKNDDLHKLKLQELQRICFDRGFYSSESGNDKMFRNWLQDWIKISVDVSENEMSLSGYCAFLLAVNHPVPMKKG